MRLARRIRPIRALAALTALAAAAAPAFGWGHTGHALINKLAVDTLPDGPLKSFMKKSRDYIAEHAVDPDEYKRHHRAEEGPKHFLNIDEGGTKPEDYPKTWKAVVDKFGLHTALKQGKVPWAIEDTFNDLVAAFKAKDAARIVEKATWLGHYVGDAHQPFHACANYDGQLTGQKGIHAIFESAMVDHHEDDIEHAAVKLDASMKVEELQGSISAWALERVIQSDKLAHEILQKDKGRRSNAREKALWKSVGSIAEKRIAEAANGLASLWLTAWIRAGKPDLPGEARLPSADSPKGGDEGDDGSDHEGGEMPAEGAKPSDAPKGDAPKGDAPKPETPAPAAKATAAVAGPFDGFNVRDDESQPGAIVDSVTPSGNVASAGIVAGDIIIAVDGAPVNSTATLAKRCKELKSGSNVPFTILREGSEHTFTVTIP